jgi:hypothetical protein
LSVLNHQPKKTSAKKKKNTAAHNLSSIYTSSVVAAAESIRRPAHLQQMDKREANSESERK